ncbi:DNA-binding protein [Planococcus antarcticus DSM 14505]|uniref:DNA-binding protein n=1 Tax=Planococcus antarcticus DSM 14505 TaxID=1185653 RepID=A0ABM6D4L4_9BACL|nr:HIRAN domain-containing protein [Planococcus antarcticus]ANU10136.1 DNA-binding protein [Planococcus antarcticus DSM 14505]
MRKRPFELWLIWQNVETRQRYHIGKLFHEDGVYTFSYERQGYRRRLEEAMEQGYRPHLAFPEINKTYTSQKLFGPFARRLPDSRRPDYSYVLQKLGLSNDCTEMDMLRATGGILATDSYEFVSPILVEQNSFNYDFYVAGWRYYKGDKVLNQLQVGDSIEFTLDPENVHDHRAVEVHTQSGDKLGFIPAFYSGWMFEIIAKNCSYEAKVEAIHPLAVDHRKVSISIVGEVNRSVDIQEVLEDKDELRVIMY